MKFIKIFALIFILPFSVFSQVKKDLPDSKPKYIFKDVSKPDYKENISLQSTNELETFFTVKGLKKKVVVLEEWTERLQKEYPRRYKNMRPSLYEDYLLLTDELFVPIFGTSFSNLSKTQLDDISSFIVKIKKQKNRKYLDKIDKQLQFLYGYTHQDNYHDLYQSCKDRIYPINRIRRTFTSRIERIKQSNSSGTRCKSEDWDYFNRSLNSFWIWPSEKIFIKELEIECKTYFAKENRKRELVFIQEKQRRAENKFRIEYEKVENTLSNASKLKKMGEIYNSILPNTSPSFEKEWRKKLKVSVENVSRVKMKEKYEQLVKIPSNDYEKLIVWRTDYRGILGGLVLLKLYNEKDFEKHPMQTIHTMFIDKLDSSLSELIPTIKIVLIDIDKKEFEKLKIVFLMHECQELAVYSSYNTTQLDQKVPSLGVICEMFDTKEKEFYKVEQEQNAKERAEKVRSGEMCECCQNTSKTCITCHGSGSVYYYNWTLKMNTYKRCTLCGGRGTYICSCCKRR